ncbi:MAG TPA: hypothetical protein VGM30_13300 [Puia sp.]|jgi:hypothetical protein
MKKHIKLLSSISLFLVLSAPAFSKNGKDDEEIKRQRVINKHYDVTADDKLEIENQFGNVVVSTWDKNEITVDIEIVANAPTDERAKQIMDEIDVKDYNSSHIISFKTKVGEIHNGKGNHNESERSFYIDYVIHMPSANRLQIENSFGKIEVPAFKGLVTLTSKFGSLNAGKLENVDAIDVEFGKAYLTEINNGKVAFKFNKESRIGKVNGNVKITSEFSHNVQFNITDKIQDLSVFESYSGVRMVVDKDLSAQIDVHTSFGSFHNDSEFAIRERKEDEGDYGPHFDKDFSGKAGEGNAKIKIKSSFGSVRLSHINGGTDDDDKGDKDKDKNKSKHKDKDKDRDDDTKTT